MKMKKHGFSEIVSMGWPIVAEMLLIALISNGNQYVWNRFSANAVATIGSWLGYISDFVIKAVCSAVRFHKGLWKDVQIV